jgi:hypothetical protein
MLGELAIGPRQILRRGVRSALRHVDLPDKRVFGHAVCPLVSGLLTATPIHSESVHIPAK